MKRKPDFKFKVFSALLIAGFINYLVYFFLYKFTSIDKQSLSLLRTVTGVALAFYLTNKVVTEHYYEKEQEEKEESERRKKAIREEAK